MVREDQVSGAPTLLYKVLVDRGVSWGQACELLTETVAAAKASAERAEVGIKLIACLICHISVCAGRATPAHSCSSVLSVLVK